MSGPPLTWFQHFHKAGGSSLVELARRNDETLHQPNANGNPLDDRGKVLPLWELSPSGLRDFVESARSRGVTFVATEWGVPDLRVLREIGAVRTVAVVREPISRLISNFRFDYVAGFTRARSLADYVDHHIETHTRTNYYARLLLGSAWREDGDVGSTVHLALQQSRLFDHVAILGDGDPFAEMAEQLGWEPPDAHELATPTRRSQRAVLALKAAAKGRVDHAVRVARMPPEPTEDELAELRELNAVDIAFFEALSENHPR